MSQEAVQPSSEVSRPKGVLLLLIVAGILALLRIGTAYASVTPSFAMVLSVVTTILFVAVPILAIFRAASDAWTARLGFGLLAVGVAAHIGGVVLARYLLHDQGFLAVLLIALAQSGLLLWCVALGALLALLIKDKNLLLPVAIFLAGLDVFLVVAPIGLTKQIVEKNPELFRSVAYAVPKVSTGPAPGVIVPMAFIGPADFFFLAMFFVALFRFHMRTGETFRWIVPVLLAYLMVVMGFGSVQLGPISLAMLPALVPIGLTVMLVNRKEFHLAKDEKVATIGVGVIALALAGAGIWMSLRAAKEPTARSSIAVPERASSAPEPLSEGPPQ